MAAISFAMAGFVMWIFIFFELESEVLALDEPPFKGL